MICPPGAGLDTHRFWEALVLNTVPIVFKTEPIYYFYKSLAIDFLLVNDWSEVQTVIREHAQSLKNRPQMNPSVLTSAYWIALVKSRLKKHGHAVVYVTQGPRGDDYEAAIYLQKNIVRLQYIFNKVDVYYVGRCISHAHPHITFKCLHDPSPIPGAEYFQNLALVRNKYLTHALQHKSDYFIVIDSDMCIRWPTLDGFRDFLSDAETSVGSAYGLGQPKTCEENKYIDKLAYQGPKNFSSAVAGLGFDSRIETNGAFGGLAIYRTRDIRKSGCTYNTTTKICEHHDFHNCLHKMGLKQTIYTNLVIYWKTAIHCHNVNKMPGRPPTLFQLCRASWSE